MTQRQIHESVTEARVIARCTDQMYSLDNPGICLACGVDADGCEPDAEKYTCEVCEEPQVYGAQQILIAQLYHTTKESV